MLVRRVAASSPGHQPYRVGLVMGISGGGRSNAFGPSTNSYGSGFLADALQDAGHTSEDILTHCRDTMLTATPAVYRSNSVNSKGGSRDAGRSRPVYSCAAS